MTITIRDRQLEFSVDNLKVENELIQYDEDLDGVINFDMNEANAETVTDIFVKCGAMTGTQGKGFRHFFDFYNDVKEATALLDSWQAQKSCMPVFGCQYSFGSDQWDNEVLPTLTGDGIFANGVPYLPATDAMDDKRVGSAFSAKAYYIFHQLSNDEVITVPPFQTQETDCDDLYHADSAIRHYRSNAEIDTPDNKQVIMMRLFVDPNDLPAAVRDKLTEGAVLYGKMANEVNSEHLIFNCNSLSFSNRGDLYTLAMMTLKIGVFIDDKVCEY